MTATTTTRSKSKKKTIDPNNVPSLTEIMAGVKSFEAEILSDTGLDFDAPYLIPFNHVGLQLITGGIIGGKMAEISADSQCGKSFLLYELIANTQKLGGYGKLYDYERALEKAYAKIAGINLDNGTVALERNPDMAYFFTSSVKFVTAIRDFEKANRRPKAPILIGVDSFPGMQTSADLKNMTEGKEMRGYAAMQKNALFSQEIARFVQFIGDNEATVVFLNQTRIDHSIEFGDKTVTPAQNTIKFYCTQRIRGTLSKNIVKMVTNLEKKEIKIKTGASVIWETIKNRYVKPFQKVTVRFKYSSGLEVYSGLDDLLFINDRIVPSTTSIDAEGNKVKPIKGFKLKNSEDKNFYPGIKELVIAHPELLVPARTGTYDDGDSVEDAEIVSPALEGGAE